MSSPVGHSLGGYIIAGRYQPAAVSSIGFIGAIVFLIFSANAPDLDFLAGAAMGDFNGYHHRASHSVAAVFLFAGLVYLVAVLLKLRAANLAAMGALAYASHLALDFISDDKSAPFGMQLLWPINEHFYIAPQFIFMNIEHGAMSDGMISSLPSIFSMHNLTAIGLELTILGPLALIVYWRRTHKQKSK